MGYIAREFNVKEFPQGSYRWYVFFLTSKNNTPTDEALINNFLKFANNIDNEDQKNLALHFYNSSLDKALQEIYPRTEKYPVPAIVISNVSPLAMDKDANGIQKINQPLKFFIFPLTNSKFYTEDRIKIFLNNLAVSLKNDGLNEFQTEIQIQKIWFWLSDYVEIKPKLFGCSIKITKIIDDIINKNYLMN